MKHKILATGDLYFGLCPHCRSNDGYINVGRGHWFYCQEHRVKWFIGSNLFSWWREQSEAEQREIYDRLGFGKFQRIEPATATAEETEAALQRERLEPHRADDDVLPF